MNPGKFLNTKKMQEDHDFHEKNTTTSHDDSEEQRLFESENISSDEEYVSGDEEGTSSGEEGESGEGQEIMKTMSLQRKVLELAIEIKSLKSQMPLVDKNIDIKIKQAEAELKNLYGKAEHFQIDNLRRRVTDKCEIAAAETQLEKIPQIVKQHQNLDLLRTRENITDIRNPINRKRKNLALEWDVTNMETQLPYLPELLGLYKQTEIARLKNELRRQNYISKRQKKIETAENLQLNLVTKQIKEEWKDWVEKEPEYLLDPVSTDPETGQNTITVSDRVIKLNGVIVYRSADYIADRINYYNNMDSDKPIFLIIDYCPGGSVMSGFRILKAMESCQAPIYVIVTSFAASMAAAITTMADKSFILPNAEILHHQMLSGVYRANMTQAKEWYESLTKAWERLASPIAKKLGYTLDEWVDELYKNNSDADWSLYGDEAVKQKWVGDIVNKIRYTGKNRNPDWIRRRILGHRCQDDGNNKTCWCHKVDALGDDKEETDEDIMTLRKLRPRDFCWIYNPNNYYKVEK